MKKNNPSPLRYPGGKIKIKEEVAKLISKTKISDVTYIEPFAGGSALALNLLFEDKIKKVILNDYDYAIYSFWVAILNNTEEFIEKINIINITIEEWEIQKNIYLNPNVNTQFDLGFATFFLNRTNRSGIIKGGAIGGKKQEGNYKIDCRFNKDKLIDKINKIANYKDKIDIYNMDAKEFIRGEYISDSSFIYLDPPYVERGKELYQNFFNIKDHEELADSIRINLQDKYWIVTYDNKDIIHNIYTDYNKRIFDLSYSAGNNKKGQEVMIYSNKFTL